MEKKEIDWEERKYELVKAFTQTLIQREDKSNNELSYSYGVREDIVETAKKFADEIIKQLK